MIRHATATLIAALIAATAVTAASASQQPPSVQSVSTAARPLIDAVKRGDGAAVETLLRQSIDPNASEADGATALHWAAHLDDLDTADRLLRAGATVTSVNDLGVTPLWLACLNGSADMIGRLLTAGADPNAALPSGETPLMTASRTGNAEAVRLLVTHGANLSATEHERGQTALMWAVAQRHPGVVRVLIAAGADVQARSTVRHRVVNTETGGFDDKGIAETDFGGYTALLFAAQQGDVESARLLLDAGADVNDVAPEGTSALVIAAHSGHSALGVFLLDRGADANAMGAGYGALHAAILRGDEPLVRALLAHGADPEAPLVQGTPARRSSPDYVLDYTMVKATPFWIAARLAEPSLMRLLLAEGANPRFLMKDGTTAIIAAIQATRRVEPGFVADAAENERLSFEAVQLAVEGGAYVNAVLGETGNTALHTAVTRKFNSVIEYLAEHGAALEVMNKKQQTPLGLAAAGGGQTDENPTADLLRRLGAKETKKEEAAEPAR